MRTRRTSAQKKTRISLSIIWPIVNRPVTISSLAI